MGIETAVTQIWAKVDDQSGRWHPLVNHLVETGVVAALLWDEILAPCTRQVIADGLGLPLDEARQWTLFLVAAHDLGKASPSFQSKWPPSVTKLADLGYRFPSNVSPVPHGRITAMALADLLADRGLHKKVANELANAAGGHHGGEWSPRAWG